MSTVEITQSYINTLTRNQQFVAPLRNSARSRLVWFVAIAGYALLNARPYWEAIRGRSLTGIEIIWLSIPWAVSALFGIITHFLMDELAVKQDTYYTSMIAVAELHKIRLTEGGADPNEFLQIVGGTHPNFKPKKDKADAHWVGEAL